MSKARVSPLRSGFVHLALAGYTVIAAVDQPILEAVGVTRGQRAAALASLAVPLVTAGALVAVLIT